MVNLEDIEQIFSKDEIAERRKKIKEEQDFKRKLRFEEMVEEQKREYALRDSGHARIIITKNPRTPVVKQVIEKAVNKIPPKEIVIDTTAINTTIANVEEDINEIVGKELPDEQDQKTLKNKIKELQDLINQLPQKPEE